LCFVAKFDGVDFTVQNCYAGNMPTTVTIPDEILRAFPDGGKAPDRRVIESVVLDLYRDQVISTDKVAELLGIYRLESDKLLARKGLLRELTPEDVQNEKVALDKVFGR